MRSKSIYLVALTAVFMIGLSAASAFGQRHGRGNSVQHPSGYIGPPIVENRRNPVYRTPQVYNTARVRTWQGRGNHRGWMHKKYTYGYRNYGQYRRTQVGSRRYRTLKRPFWGDRRRVPPLSQ